MATEIERKFLISNHDGNAHIITVQEIHQTYLVTGDEEVRIRKIIDIQTNEVTYTMAKKFKSKEKILEREEIEFPLYNEDTYEALLQMSRAKPLVKTRITYQFENYLIEVDNYRNSGIDLRIAEVEFESLEKAKSFVPPDWLYEDVTDRKEYKNTKLWKSIQK